MCALVKTLCAFVVAAALLAGASGEASAKRIALVIGNDSYENVVRLEKARGDAREMTRALEALGFEVIAAVDVDRRAMSEQIFAFTSRIDQNDEALFFFAGHGVRHDGRNYLLPVDVPEAGVGAGDLVADSAFAADEIGERMRRRTPRVSVMILDACRDNPFTVEGADGTRAAFGGTRGLSRMEAPVGTFIMFSAGEGERALDRVGDNDPDPNSLFTRNLIRAMSVPGRSLLDVAKDVQREVYTQARAVAHEQAPAIYDRIVGDYCLAPGPGGRCGGGGQAAPGPAPDPAPQQSACRDLLFEQALQIGTREALGAFLSGCAEGPQAALARAALAKLEQQGADAGGPGGDAAPRAGAGAGGQTASSFWDHNDSLMYLVADGSRRWFYYERPREGMVRAGARAGTLLFEGSKQGNSYQGTAYVFSPTCGPIGYQVSGPIEDQGTRVVMFGRAPVRDSACRVVRTRDDRLVFDYVSKTRP